jgi:polar amino acid transport system permease protein
MIRELNAGDFLYIVAAARWTIALSIMAILCGGLLGFGIMFARLARSGIVRGTSLAHIQFFQATPLLMQLFLVFFGGSLFGLRLDPWTAALIAFSLHSSAFLGDIWHGCILSVPKSQWEGAKSLALPHWVTMRQVIIPQAGRLAVAPTMGFLVQRIKRHRWRPSSDSPKWCARVNSSTMRRCNRCLWPSPACFTFCAGRCPNGARHWKLG